MPDPVLPKRDVFSVLWAVVQTERKCPMEKELSNKKSSKKSNGFFVSGTGKATAMLPSSSVVTTGAPESGSTFTKMSGV